MSTNNTQLEEKLNISLLNIISKLRIFHYLKNLLKTKNMNL